MYVFQLKKNFQNSKKNVSRNLTFSSLNLQLASVFHTIKMRKTLQKLTTIPLQNRISKLFWTFLWSKWKCRQVWCKVRKHREPKKKNDLRVRFDVKSAFSKLARQIQRQVRNTPYPTKNRTTYSKHPEFGSHDFFVAAESYGGVYGPMLSALIMESIHGREFPNENFKVGVLSLIRRSYWF